MFVLDADRTPPKKAKQTFKTAYSNEWTCLKPSLKGNFYVLCTMCNSNFSCHHGGKFDCQRHINSKGHQENEQIIKTTRTLDTFTSKNVEDDTIKTTRAELILCRLIARMNWSLAFVKRHRSMIAHRMIVPAFKQMFPRF